MQVRRLGMLKVVPLNIFREALKCYRGGLRVRIPYCQKPAKDSCADLGYKRLQQIAD